MVGNEPDVAKYTMELTPGVEVDHVMLDELLVNVTDEALTVGVVENVAPPGDLPDQPAANVTAPAFDAVVPLITRIAQLCELAAVGGVIVKLPLLMIYCRGTKPQFTVNDVPAVRTLVVTIAPPLSVWLVRLRAATVFAPA